MLLFVILPSDFTCLSQFEVTDQCCFILNISVKFFHFVVTGVFKATLLVFGAVMCESTLCSKQQQLVGLSSAATLQPSLQPLPMRILCCFCMTGIRV